MDCATTEPSGCTTQPGMTEIRFSTADYAPHERVAAWREVYGRTMCRLDIEAPDSAAFHTDVVLRKLPGLSLMSGVRSPALYRRNRNQAENDNVFVTIALAGGFEATQLGRSARMAEGDALVGTGAEAMDFHVFPDCRSVTLSVPRQAISPAVGGLDTMFGQRIPAENPALRLMTRYIDIIDEPGNLAVPMLQRHAVAHVHDLLALALGATRDAAQAAKARGASAARLHAIQADIEENLGRADLSAAAIATRHRLPLRYLQRLFEAEGTTCTAFVLERRLARAHKMLSDPRLSHRPVSDIAFDVGFGHLSRFNTAFRARFGATPSDLRMQVRRDH
jgi:AraC-like DNA-binding protein